LQCFAGAVGASAATLFVREPRGDTHVAASWTRDRRHAADRGVDRAELIERAFEADGPLLQSAVDGDRQGHSAVAAAFRSDERVLGALHAAFEPPSTLTETDLIWAADSYAHLAALCLTTEPNFATVLGSAPIDALTGCLSHEGAIELLEGEVERSRRRAHRLSCCLLEIEGLDQVTATGGQIESDRVRAVAGQALRQASRLYDAVGRFGADEFIVVMPEAGGSGPRSAAERFRRLVRLAVADATSAQLDVSLGVAEWDGESSATDLVEAAARAATERAEAASAGDMADDSLAKLTTHLARPLGGDAGRFSPRIGVRRRRV
jgi:diguanylate cyclase (GGDEF)-like protein